MLSIFDRFDDGVLCGRWCHAHRTSIGQPRAQGSSERSASEVRASVEPADAADSAASGGGGAGGRPARRRDAARLSVETRVPPALAARSVRPPDRLPLIPRH